MSDKEKKLCQACQRGHHEDCSGQVSAAKSPCDCGHCWGEGGSEAAHAAATRHWGKGGGEAAS